VAGSLLAKTVQCLLVSPAPAGQCRDRIQPAADFSSLPPPLLPPQRAAFLFGDEGLHLSEIASPPMPKPTGWTGGNADERARQMLSEIERGLRRANGSIADLSANLAIIARALSDLRLFLLRETDDGK